MNKKIIIILILTIILPNIVFAEEITINQPTINIGELKSHVTAENVKTRTELTIYTDRKIEDMIETVNNRGQQFINENFKELDKQMRSFISEVFYKALLGIIASIILGNAIWYWIKRKIESKRKKPTRTIEDKLTKHKYGILSEEYKKRLIKEKDSVSEKSTFSKTGIKEPKPPSITKIEEIIKKNKEEMLRKKQETIKKSIAQKENNIFELSKKAEKKESKKIFNNTEKLEKRMAEELIDIEKLRKKLYDDL